MNDNSEDWEILIIDVSEVEATVRVHYRGATAETVSLRGTLRGPYCERAHTLPADYPFRTLPSNVPTAEAIITDPCPWSEEVPHLYRAEVAALCGSDVLAEYHGEVGLRPTRPPQNFDHIK